MSPRRLVPVAAVAVALAFVLAPPTALAQCNYPFMGSGSSMYFPFGQTYTPTVVQPTNYWSVVAVRPDVLVKGGDWGVDHIIGRDEVEAAGGRVLSLPFVDGCSTSDIIQRILERETHMSRH